MFAGESTRSNDNGSTRERTSWGGETPSTDCGTPERKHGEEQPHQSAEWGTL